MTNKTTEALKLAEEALQAELEAINSDEFDAAADKCYEALAAIREALAEQEKQEPVAWVNAERNTITWEKIYPNMEPLYAAPVSAPAQEPVAWGRVFDGDIIDCICPEEHALNEGDYSIPLYAAPVSAKMQGDCTLAEPANTRRCSEYSEVEYSEQDKQEPVAWMVYTEDGKSVYVTDNPTDIKQGLRSLPLYVEPVK